MLYQVQVSGGDNWSSGPYLYDGAGNVKRIGSQRYKYDRMSRLVEGEVLVGAQEKTQSLSYDAFGNILSLNTDGSTQSNPTRSSTNRLNADYDAGGNLTDVTLGGETYEYTYDPLNMMKYLQSDTGQARVFLYDADDERIMTFDCAFVDGDCATEPQLTTTIRGLDGKVLRIYNQPFGGAWNWSGTTSTGTASCWRRWSRTRKAARTPSTSISTTSARRARSPTSLGRRRRSTPTIPSVKKRRIRRRMTSS
jgi:hypothetical protein